MFPFIWKTRFYITPYRGAFRLIGANGYDIRMSAAIQNVTCLGELKMIVLKEMHPFVGEDRTLQTSKSWGPGQSASGVTWLPGNNSAKPPVQLWQ
jgi:hypothetical protein